MQSLLSRALAFNVGKNVRKIRNILSHRREAKKSQITNVSEKPIKFLGKWIRADPTKAEVTEQANMIKISS